MVIAAVLTLVIAAGCAAYVAALRRAQAHLLATGELYRGGTERLESALELSDWVERVGIGAALLGVLFSGLATDEPLLAVLAALGDALAVALIAVRTNTARKEHDSAVKEALEQIARS
jgi:hypothetical protein